MKKNAVIIVGAGPAGLTAAIQLQRVGIPFLLFESRQIGGLLHNANLVENYPGFPRGIEGVRLVSLLKKQSEHIGVEILSEKVTSLEYDGEHFIAFSDENDYYADIAFIASGTKPRQFPNGLISKETKNRVFYEVRDLLDVSGEEIIIVGAGDAAFDYALNLAKRNNRVKILNRGREIRALDLLVNRVRKNERISYFEEAQVVSVTDAGEQGLTVQTAHQGNVEITRASFLLGALGRVPKLDFLSEGILQDEVELVERGILHFIGDVRNGIFRQTAIAAGDGLRAAMKVEKLYKERS